MASSRHLRLLAVVLAFAIVGLVVFLLTRSGSGNPQEVDGGRVRDEAGAVTSAPSTRLRDAAAPVAPIRPKSAPADQPVEAAATRSAPSAGIKGRVVTGEGAGIAGARVFVERALDYSRDRMSRGGGYLKVQDPVSQTTTDAAGRFELIPLAPRAYVIQCEKAGFGWERKDLRVLPERIAQVEAVLSPARDLPGEVVDAAGAPVPGAEVFIAFSSLSRTVADELGRFMVTLPGPRSLYSVTIRASKAGVGIGSESFLSRRLPAILRVPLYPTRKLTCRFQPDDGSPPPANLRFSVTTEILPRHFVFVGKTDDTGAGTIASLPEVDRVEVLTDDATWCLPWPGGRSNAHVTTGVERPVAPFGDVIVEIPVVRTGSLSGTVIDRTSGKPVPGLPILAYARASYPTPSGRHYQVSGVTDEAGSFRLTGLQRAETGIATRTTRWLVWPDGWDGGAIPARGVRLSFWSGQHALNQSPSVEGVVVKVVESGTVEGNVVDASGTPVDAAEIDAGLEPMDPRMQSAIDGRPYREDFTTTTDTAGRFLLRGLYPAAGCRVRARRPNAPWTWSEPFDLAPGATQRAVRIALPAGKQMTVTVVGPDGSPVPGVDVLVMEGEQHAFSGRVPFFKLPTGTDGSATFSGLTSEKASAGVDAETLPPGLQAAEVFSTTSLPPGGVTRLTVNLQRELLLTGKVVLEDGKAPGEGSITAIAVGDAPTGQTTEFGKVTADGSFSIPVRSSRLYTIRELMTTLYVPRGPGASLDMRLEKFVPAKQQELRPGEPSVIILRRG